MLNDFFTFANLRLWLLVGHTILWDAFHIGIHTTIVMVVVSWFEDSFWYWLVETIILIEIDKLWGGYFMIEMIKNFLSIVAINPWTVLINLRLLSLNSEWAVTPLCAFHLLHHCFLLFIYLECLFKLMSNKIWICYTLKCLYKKLTI